MIAFNVVCGYAADLCTISVSRMAMRFVRVSMFSLPASSFRMPARICSFRIRDHILILFGKLHDRIHDGGMQMLFFNRWSCAALWAALHTVDAAPHYFALTASIPVDTLIVCAAAAANQDFRQQILAAILSGFLSARNSLPLAQDLLCVRFLPVLFGR